MGTSDVTDLVSPNPCGDLSSWHGHRIAHGGAPPTPFTEEDVAEVIASYDSAAPHGYLDEGNVACVVRLKDGRFVSWETFYGVTGDGFHEDAYGGEADIHYAGTLDDIIRFGLTDEGRENLKLTLP